MQIFRSFAPQQYARWTTAPASRADNTAAGSEATQDTCDLSSSAVSDEVKKTRQAAVHYAISSLAILAGLAGIAVAAPVAVPLAAYALGGASLLSGLLVDPNPFG